MSTLSSLNRSMMRISGLNSGMDTDSMVRDMMRATQLKVDRQFRTHTALQWKQDKNIEVNNILRKLKDEFSTVLKQDQNMLSELNFRSFAVNMVNAGDSAYVTATAQPYATAGEYTVDFVKQLATAGRAETITRTTWSGNGLNISHTLASIDSQLLGDLSFTGGENGERVIKFSLDGKDYVFDENTSLDTVISTFNASSANLEMGYSQLTDKFTLSTKTMGSSSSVTPYLNSIDANTQNFLTAFGIDITNEDSIIRGQNAIFSINGQAKTFDSNEVELNGVTFSLKRAFGVDASGNPDGSKNVSLTVSRDVQKSVDVIKKYIEGYNEMVGKLNDILTEAPPRNYNTGESWQPLTDEEKAEMTEEQIEQWEEKAKSGIMRNDGTLQRLVSDLRMSFYTKAENTNKLMFEIGIKPATSGSYDDSLIGKLEIDEVQLREALLSNPDEVFRMFTEVPEETSEGGVEGMGVVTRVNKLIDNYIDHNEQVTQYYGKQELDRAMNRYVDMLEAMADEEDRLWAKMTNMERLMGEMQSQSNWFAQQLGGGQ